MANFKSYVICTSPRSGSTLLCKLLAATGIAGNPASYFHNPSISDWLNQFDLTPEASTPARSILDSIFKAAIIEGSLDTGMFGLRLQQPSFDFFSLKLAVLYPGHSSDTQRFRAAFGETLFIHLTRRDKVEQAVSYVKAEQTGLWHMAPDGTELERQSPPQTPTYNEDLIRERVGELTAYDRMWESWFAAENTDPLCITYETLSADPIKMLSRVLDHLGLDSQSIIDVKPDVAKLADKTNQDWVARFRSRYPIA